MAKLEERLRYIIEAIWKGEGATAAASRDIEGVGKASEKADKASAKLKTSWLALGAAVGTLAIAAKTGWEALEAGAEIEKTADQFDRLAQSIGTTSDALKNRLAESTGGMLTSAEMMRSGVEIISLGLATTEENVARLAGLVAKLGWDMQTVIMTFANDSKMRLDALGLSVTDVEERMKKFTDAGMSVGEAFDLAVIEAGEAKLNLLGDTALITTGQLDILKTAIQEVKEQAQLAIAAGLGPFIAALTGANVAGIAAASQQNLDLADSLDAVGAAARGAQFVFDMAAAQPFGDLEPGIKQIHEAVDLMVRFADSKQAAFDELRESFSGGALEEAMEYWLSIENSMAFGRTHIVGMGREAGTFAAEMERAAAAGRALGQEGGLLGNLGVDEGWRAAAALEAINAPMREMIRLRDEAARAATTERRQEFGGFIEFDTSNLGAANAVMLETATNAGAAAEQLYTLMGGGQAAGDALLEAAAKARAAKLGEAVAAGLITAKAAAEDLQTFMAGLTLEDVFDMDEPIAGAGEAVETAKQEMLRVVEGIEPAVAEAAAPALEAVSAVDEALKLLDEVTATPEIQDNAADSQENLTEYRRYWDANIAGLSTTHTINIQYVTEGMPPGAPPPGRAMGGPVLPGSPYVVGEKGPELFIPKAAGDIVPASVGSAGAWGASAPAVVVQNFNGLGVGGAVAVARRTLANYTRGTR